MSQDKPTDIEHILTNTPETSLFIDEPPETLPTAPEPVLPVPPVPPVVAEPATVVEPITVAEPIIPDTETPVTPARKQQRVKYTYDVNSKHKLTSGDTVILPTNFRKETLDVMSSVPNIDIIDSDQAKDWADTVGEGLGLLTVQEVFVPTLEDETAEFTHDYKVNGMDISGTTPKFQTLENTNLKGERAVIRMISHLGMGSLFQVPLWHSGIRVTFKPPSESEIVELNRILMSDKIQLGRYTYGLAFSNITSYTINRLMDFAISHIYSTSVKDEDININNIKDHISSQDIFSFLWGFVCTMYPRGFKYRRACINNPEKCTYILEDTLNLTKLQWTNMLALTDWQKVHMSSRQDKVKDLASVNRYKEELVRTQSKRIEINKDQPDAISVLIKSPSVSEYIESGYNWIGSITDMVDRVLEKEANSDERNDLILQHGKASAIRQYAHWVASIEYETNVVDDKDTLNALLGILSADDEIRAEFIKGVIEYINSSTVSIIGLPAYDCPACGTSQEGEAISSVYKNIIPLDVVQLFFVLLTQRLERLSDR